MPGPKKGAPQYKKGTRLGTCSIEGCTFNVLALGLCIRHYEMHAQAEKEAIQRKIDSGEFKVGKNGRAIRVVGSGGLNGGRPQAIPYDESTIRRLRDLAGLQCTLQEAAGVMQVSHETLGAFLEQHEDAADAFNYGRLNGRASLRRIQFVQAKRSAAMAIWLGKNYLGQHDSDLRIGPAGGNNLSDELGDAEGATALLRAVREEAL